MHSHTKKVRNFERLPVKETSICSSSLGWLLDEATYSAN